MIKKISDSLKQQADKAKDSVSDATGKLKDLGTSGMDQAKDAMGLLRDKLNDVKDIGFDKLKAGIDELSNGLPLIEQAGFEIHDINIGIGIPPEVALSFKKTNTVSSTDIQKIIDDNQDKKILVPILQALLTANNMQSKITMGKFRFTGVGIKVGIPPEVSLRYS
jgi:hypothetical protein